MTTPGLAWMPDVNVLIYAHRSDERQHAAARAFLEAEASTAKTLLLAAPVALGFVRIVTNPRIFAQPTPLPVALATIDALLARPNCRLVGAGMRTWELTRALCARADARGKLVADAQLAAFAIEQGCVFVSYDRDFARFEAHGLRWTLPTSP